MLFRAMSPWLFVTTAAGVLYAKHDHPFKDRACVFVGGGTHDLPRVLKVLSWEDAPYSSGRLASLWSSSGKKVETRNTQSRGGVGGLTWATEASGPLPSRRPKGCLLCPETLASSLPHKGCLFPVEYSSWTLVGWLALQGGCGGLLQHPPQTCFPE